MTKIRKYSWKQFDLDVDLLAKEVSTSIKPKSILAISRGGLPLGIKLSNLLDLPLSIICARSYFGNAHKHARTEAKIVGMIKNNMCEPILVVDDIADTGITLLRVCQNLKRRHGFSDIHSAVLFYKRESEFIPNYYARMTNAWIEFPWER